MAKNESLHKAKREKMDEYYTQRVDIENELGHYAQHFNGKTVYCNCDDPVSSEFWMFFRRVFRTWGLKKLVATHYEPDERNYSYSLELNDDTEPVIRQLPCNGDFRSAACIELLREADIVVTNPPFSVWREYVAQLIEYDKKFVIIGSLNAITYKDIFPLLKGDKMWLGYGFQGGNAYFRLAENADPAVFSRGVYNPETGLVKFRNCCWYTNLDIPKRHEPIDLRGNYYHGNEEAYPKYDNFNAIEVSHTADIPCDYDGVMGVPVSFMNKYCPEQFDIIWEASGNTRSSAPPGVLEMVGYERNAKDRGGCALVKGRLKYDRILIRRRASDT